MSADIQKARDALAKWRDASVAIDPQPWKVTHPWPRESDVVDANGAPVRSDGTYAEDEGSMAPETARLIVGTAGNPDLLAAIDYILAGALAQLGGTNDGRLSGVDEPGAVEDAQRIAAAILIADEAMS